MADPKGALALHGALGLLTCALTARLCCVKGLFSIGYNTPTGTRIEAALHDGEVQIYTDTGQWRTTGFEPTHGQWFRFRLERSGGIMRLIVDGQVRWEVPNTRNYSPPTGQPALRIGPHVDYFAGYMDNFVISSARLTT